MTKSHTGIFDRSDAADRILGPRCREALIGLGASNDAESLQALADPRNIHKALYHDLTPETSPEMAGNYRGSEYPSLKDKIVLFSFNETEGTTKIARPWEVGRLMHLYADMLRVHGMRKPPNVEAKLATVAPLMVFFGYIHPFADGNGHIQRITVQCLIEKAGFAMSPTWSVHPCPYGEEVHRALAAADHGRLAALLSRFVA